MDMPTQDYQQFMRMWMDFASQMTAAGASVASEFMPVDAAKRMQELYFRTLSQYTEQYMRSPQFLEMIRQTTDTAVTLRKQANDFMADAQHAAGGVARPDVDSLLMAVRRSESRVLDRLDELSSRVEELESRLVALESGNGKPARKSK